MNIDLLNTDVQLFIDNNLNNDLTKLILKGSPFKNVNIQELAQQIKSKKKCFSKLPLWHQTAQLYFPRSIHIEQSSSEVTAKYKTALVSGKSLVDISGGFGVDTYYFSKKISKVFHCEIDPELSNIANYNFEKLQSKNISSKFIDGLEFIKNSKNELDWIYADPSRRNSVKGKVFLLEDCLPNIPEHIDLLFSKTNNVLLKTAPLLDITSAINSLKYVKEVHVIAIRNDVKELIFILEKNWANSISIKTINFGKTDVQKFNFEYHSDSNSSYDLPNSYIFEPNAAILKSGGFHEIGTSFNLHKLHPNSHLYTSNQEMEFPGRVFKLLHCVPYHKKTLKKLLPLNKANITTRNFPESVSQIRKKTGLKDGGQNYLFFTTDLNENRCVLVCSKV